MVDIERSDTIAEVVRRHGRDRGDKVAIRCGHQSLTYGELDMRSNRVAHGLMSSGIKRQARIAVLACNCPAFFELWFGAANADAVVVPVHLRYAPAEITAVVNDAEAEFLSVGAEFYTVAEAIQHDLPSVRAIIAIDGGHARWPSYAQWTDAYPADDPRVPLRSDSCALQIYSDDSNVEPKGAQLSHAGLMQMVIGARGQFGDWRDRDVSIVCVPMFHLTGSGWALVGLCFGVETVLVRRFEPAECLHLIRERRVTKAMFVTSMILHMLQQPQSGETAASSLELVVYGGPLTPLAVLDRALKRFGCDFAQVFGLTEITGIISCLSIEDHRVRLAEGLKSYGRPMPDVELKIVNGHGKELRIGHVGEVVCRAPRLMLGYWKQPKATARSIRDGWFHTGKLGYLDPDGYLRLCESFWKTAQEFWQV